QVLLAGVAGLVAGAMSMAAGEYVSVSSQADSEAAERARETAELAASPVAERDELTAIYVARGVEPATAREVAEQLSRGDVLAAHLRDELGHSDASAARPVQAALASAGSFLVGAAAPLLVVLLVPVALLTTTVSAASLLFLALLGIIGARAGGAPVGRATLRVTFWGALAMLATAGIGRLFGAVV
ncbi:MAG: VIT1/CCC1 transporter family protein, partial [Polymorphobacter sp.]